MSVQTASDNLFDAVKNLDANAINQALSSGANPLDVNNDGNNAFDVILKNPAALHRLGNDAALKGAITNMSSTQVTNSEQLKSFGRTIYESSLILTKKSAFSNALSSRAGQYNVSLNANLQSQLQNDYSGTNFLFNSLSSSYAHNFLMQSEKNKGLLGFWINSGKTNGHQAGLDMASKYSIKTDGNIVQDGNGGFVWDEPDFNLESNSTPTPSFSNESDLLPNNSQPPNNQPTRQEFADINELSNKVLEVTAGGLPRILKKLRLSPSWNQSISPKTKQQSPGINQLSNKN